jgi:hypothetical protein
MAWVVMVRLHGRIGSGEGIAGHDGREGVESANERRGKGKKAKGSFRGFQGDILTRSRQAKNKP